MGFAGTGTHVVGTSLASIVTEDGSPSFWREKACDGYQSDDKWPDKCANRPQTPAWRDGHCHSYDRNAGLHCPHGREERGVCATIPKLVSSARQ